MTTQRARDSSDECGHLNSSVDEDGSAVIQNVQRFWALIDRSCYDISSVRTNAAAHRNELSNETLAQFQSISARTGVSVDDLVAYNLYRTTVEPEACTAAVATGSATTSGNTLFFKHSDAGLNTEFEGDGYHSNQEINVVRYDDGGPGNACLVVSGAGVTGLKMGVNEQGIAIGSTFARTTTYTADDQRDDSIEVSQGGSRSEYMRQTLVESDTFDEAVSDFTRRLIQSPMDTPGNVFIADGDRAVVVEGEFTHLATEWVEDDIAVRGNTFEVLDHLAVPGHEYPSTYFRHERTESVLTDAVGDISPETLLNISTDHKHGPGGHSVCVHPDSESEISDVDHTMDEQSATCSAVIFELDGDTPEKSIISVAMGTPCQAWRSEENEGWFSLSLGELEDGVPEPFTTGNAWVNNYHPHTPLDDGELPDLANKN